MDLEHSGIYLIKYTLTIIIKLSTIILVLL